MLFSIKACRIAFACFALVIFLMSGVSPAAEPSGDGAVVKKILKATDAGKNLLKADAWRSYEQGFERDGEAFVCDNTSNPQGRRGVAQTVVLNQTAPEPIIASALSRSEGVDGSTSSD